MVLRLFVKLPLGSKIWVFRKSVVDLERDDYGVYELYDIFYDVVYLGWGEIRCLLIEHFVDGKHPIDSVKWFSAEYTWDKDKAMNLYDEKLSKYLDAYGKYPKFNKMV